MSTARPGARRGRRPQRSLRPLAAAALAVGLLATAAAPAATAAPAHAAPPGVPLPPGGREGAWWFTSWRIPQVWATGAQGQGVTVAILDTGVARLPELRGAVLPGTGGASGDGRGDTKGHGTRMALLVAGQGGPHRLVGVAPRAKILPVVDVDTAQGIRWAVEHGAKVVSMSFTDTMPCEGPVADAVAHALDAGAVLVASTGNDGAFVDGAIFAPVNCPGVLGVGAIDADARPWAKTAVSPYADVAAPGVHMRTIDLKGRPGHSDGTSDATALTAGAVALVWSKNPALTNRQVVARLLATVRDTGAPGKDDRTGYGIVRPYQAITTDVPPDAPNPVFDEAGTPGTTGGASPSVTATALPAADAPRPAPGSPAGGPPWPLLGAAAAGLVLVVLAVVVGTRRRLSRR